MKLAFAAQMKEMDRVAIEERGIPSLDLMERAAEEIADVVEELSLIHISAWRPARANSRSSQAARARPAARSLA